jgi:MarR family transcriptional regulator, organic hydroperoxide resistance regulator
MVSTLDTAKLRVVGDADKDVSPADLAAAADELFYAMRRARAMTSGQAGDGLSLAQLSLLEPLAGCGERTVGQLAAAAAVSVPTATRMIKQLEGRGLLVRRRSVEDERRVLVALTERGEASLAEVGERHRAKQVRTLAEFGPAERAALAAQLRRLARAITEENP